ncbi:23S rRNA (pseudouridine(1915)-N(3))-methyltransferase RlmH [Candidatus Puniceispirillum sp.]|uniref:23S rRNA (pseudouridine(1915)-N(3))-methyltransferase RlmH n=1 Tax=Candidatus Puniceispirillum sp. TaxID=2026719 RepID=UPI003F6A4593
MRLHIIAVGKGRASPEATLTSAWLARLPAGGELSEIDSKLPAGPARSDDEAARILKHVPSDAALAVFDPKGRDCSSEELANLLSLWQDEGRPRACFAIGGADGHGAAVLNRADKTLSFGRAIWPHMLFRAMVAEQLYRATAILSGHPYHRPS